MCGTPIQQLIAIAVVAYAIAGAQDAKSDPQTTPIATGLGVVTSINFMNHDDLVVTKRYGNVYLFKAVRAPQKGELLFDFTKTVDYKWADGLMNAVIDASTSDLYVYASVKGSTKKFYQIYRLKYYSVPKKKFDDPVLVVDGLPYGRSHSGGAMAVVGDYLYVTTSDGEEDGFKHAQDIDHPQGKLLRIPLRAVRTAKEPLQFNSSWVFACGLRDSQGIATARYQGNTVLVSTDHGPTPVPGLKHEQAEGERDELNFIPLKRASPRVNFGWPRWAARYETVHRSKINGCSQEPKWPKRVWGSDGKEGGIAPSGIAVLQKKDHAWNGHIFIAALKGTSIRHLYTDARGAIVGEEVRFSDRVRKRVIACDREGVCYYSTSQGDQTNPKCPPPTICNDDGIYSFALGR